MCCFSRPIESVSSTRIFARRLPDQRMAVVYSMQIVASEDLAMVLPLPVFRPNDAGALEFVDLSGYKDFFKDMEAGFPRPVARSMTKGAMLYSADRSTLEIHQVGAFEASFVPTASDFGRLDERFRLPPDAVAAIPGARSMSFAVFRLAAGKADIHPMAFTYRASLEAGVRGQKVVFPTLHVHDGQAHPTAHFDHTLYCQVGDDKVNAIRSWDHSPWEASHFMKLGNGDRGAVDRARGLVDPNLIVHKRRMTGMFANIDIVV